VAAANPFLLGVVPPGAAADNMTAVATLLAVIPVPMADVASEVTLVAPPPPVVVEETREGELPISSGGGPHGLSLSSEPKAPEGRATGTELGRPAVVEATEAEVVADLPASSRELVVVQPEAGSFGGPPEGDLEWLCPEDPAKARFVLRDSRECQL